MLINMNMNCHFYVDIHISFYGFQDLSWFMQLIQKLQIYKSK